MIRFIIRQPIRRQVIAAAALLVLPFVVVAAWSANRTRLEREAEVRDQAGTIASTAAGYLDQYLAGLDSLAAALTHHPCVATLDPHACDPLLVDVLREQTLLL